MTIASIDIGTNTVLLLIANINPEDKNIIPLLNEYRLPRIGEDTSKTGLIKHEKLSLLLEVLGEFKVLINNYNCDKVIITGTNALRIAINSGEIVNKIKQHFNYELEIITGDQEAEYAYLGAISGFDDLHSTMVIDIGGGSTELIFGNNKQIFYKNSIQIGSVSATEQFLKNSPPLQSNIQNLIEDVRSKLQSLQNMKLPEHTIAVAGTATTLACMNLKLHVYDESKVEGTSLNKKQLYALISELSKLSASEILLKYGSVMKGREDIILGGAIILHQVMENFNLNEVVVSTRGIRFGAIVHWLNRTYS